MKYGIQIVAAFCTVVLCVGCKSTGPKRGFEAAPDGFSSFTSARDFDPPGQVYRVTESGEVYKVRTLEINIESGAEEVHSFESSGTWSLEGLLKTISEPTDSFSGVAKAELKRSRSVFLQADGSEREFVQDDSGVYGQLLQLFSSVPWRKGNDYYLIRETIRTKKLKYTSSKEWVGGLGIDSTLREIAEADASLSYISDDQFSLIKEFDTPLRIWFKAEKIELASPDGAVGGVVDFELKPVAPGGFKPPLDAKVEP